MLMSSLEKGDKVVVYEDSKSKKVIFTGYVNFIHLSMSKYFDQAYLIDFEEKEMVIDDTDNFILWQDHIESITESMSEKQPEYIDGVKVTVGKVKYNNGNPIKDTVNHPAHYTQGKVEVIEFIEQVTKDYNASVAYHIGNAIKYIARSPHKNGKEDIAKAKWYIERAFEQWEDLPCVHHTSLTSIT